MLEDQQFTPLVGRRVGLVTNRTGFDAAAARTVDVLAHAPGVTLAALFSPGQGLNTDVDERIGDSRDAATGLAVHSLYGGTQHFPAGSLDGIDAPVFDIQDAGVRFFTYETTLGYALEARRLAAFRSSYSIGPIHWAGSDSAARCSMWDINRSPATSPCRSSRA